jgi:superoxide dismutase, Fe-Mn family
MTDLNKLLDISDKLDEVGLQKEADALDSHILKYAKKGYHKSGLKEETVENHLTLLEDYRKALTGHQNALKKTMLSSNDKDSPNHGVLREAMKGMAYNGNSVYLHEMYIEDVYDSKPYSLEKTRMLWATLKERYVGSRNKFETDIKRIAQTPRNGWVLINFCTSTGNISIDIADLHDQGLPCSCIPITCIDMWEHAYFHDFGTDREAYIDWWLERVDWRGVEKRLKRLIRIK